MDKNDILLIGGVAVVAYVLWKFNKPVEDTAQTIGNVTGLASDTTSTARDLWQYSTPALTAQGLGFIKENLPAAFENYIEKVKEKDIVYNAIKKIGTGGSSKSGSSSRRSASIVSVSKSPPEYSGGVLNVGGLGYSVATQKASMLKTQLAQNVYRRVVVSPYANIKR